MNRVEKPNHKKIKKLIIRQLKKEPPSRKAALCAALCFGGRGWSRRDLNPRPDKRLTGFLHA